MNKLATMLLVLALFVPMVFGQTTTVTGVGSIKGSASLVTVPPPAGVVTPSSLNFGSITPGSSSSPQALTLQNTGGSSLQITSIVASSQYSQTNNCPNLLLISATCTVNVTFSPTTSGSISGTIVFSDNAPNSPQTVTLSGTGTSQGGTALSQAAAAMGAGSWVAFATNNFNNGGALNPPAPGGSGLEFSDRAGVWNAVNNTLMVLLGSHVGTEPSCTQTMFSAYIESSNSWVTNLPSPCPNFDDSQGLAAGDTDIVHPYTHQTIDAQGNFYHRQYSSGKVMVFSQGTQAWSQCTPYNTSGQTTNSWPNLGNFNAAGALTYFPDRNSLVMLDGEWGLWEMPLTGGVCTGKWTLLASTIGGGFNPQLTNIQDHHNEANYSFLCKCILLDFFWRYNSNGTLTQLAGAPFYIGIAQNAGSAIGSVEAVDPVSGHFVVWNGNVATPVGYDYNPLTDTWATTGIAVPSALWPAPQGGVTNSNVIPIPKYGVMMAIMSGSGSGSAVYLYKHTSSINGFTNRVAGVNVPGGVTSIVSSQGFESALPTCGPTFPCNSFNGTQASTQHYSAPTPSLDTTIFADGSSSLKFTIVNGSFQGDAGWYDWNFKVPGDATGLFGAGKEFYVQYKMRLGTGVTGSFPGDQGMKHDIVSEGDSATAQAASCSDTPAEIVTDRDSVGAFNGPWLYFNCNGGSSGTLFISGKAVPMQLSGAPSSDFLDQDASGCPHYGVPNGRTIPVSDPTCFIYVETEWMTVQKHIKIGAFGTASSVVEQWMAHAGKPSVLTSNGSDVGLNNAGGNITNLYGKVELLPYDTGTTWGVNTQVNYDDLIISTRRIPDPDVSTPNAPDSLSLTVATGHITVNWRVNSANGTAQDDTGFLVERCTGTAVNCMPNTQSGFTQIGTTSAGASTFQDSTTVASTTYTYRVRAKNANGNSAYTVAICFNGGTTCGGTAVAQ